MFGRRKKSAAKLPTDGNETDTGVTHGANVDVDDINARLQRLKAHAEDEPSNTDNTDAEYDDDSDDDGVIYNDSHHPSRLPPLTPAPWGHWTEDDTRGLVIRGKTFLDDKVKIPVGTPIYRLAWVDMFRNRENERCPHVAARPDSYAYQFYQAKIAKKMKGGEEVKEAPVDPNSNAFLSPMIIINFMFPGPEGNYNLVLYMVRRIRPADSIERQRERRKAAKSKTRAVSTKSDTHSNPTSPPLSPAVVGDPSPVLHSRKLSGSQSGRFQPSLSTSFNGYGSESDIHASLSHTEDHSHSSSSGGSELDIERIRAFDRCLRIFLTSDDNEKDSRVKIIPRIAEGSWIVKKGVGQTPAILGRKVKQTYYRDEIKNYIEIDADVGSSVVAGKILSLVKSAATSLIIELTFLLQGESEEELPESLLTGVRIVHPSLQNTVTYEENVAATKCNMKFPF